MAETIRDHVGFIGFGEAAKALAEGWAPQDLGLLTAYDIKTDSPHERVREDKWLDYSRLGVDGKAYMAEALAERKVVFSLVTADQALLAAEQVAVDIGTGVFYLDCNSCAPSTKRKSAELIQRAGGCYVDVAVMAPVRPALHKTPLLLSGQHAEAVHQYLLALNMVAEVVPGDVGASSSVKMIRSIFVKGLEALVTEGVLAALASGVDERVFDSLEASYPGFGWRTRAAYVLDRVITHGVRRAAEMREVAVTVEDLGLNADMTHAAIDWQQRVGDLGLKPGHDDYGERGRRLLKRLQAEQQPASPA